jgi:hypothetical protein
MKKFYRFISTIVCIIGFSLMFFLEIGMSLDMIPAEMKDDACLRARPDTKGKIIIFLKKGDRINIFEENSKWAKVTYENNGQKTDGWVSTYYLLKTVKKPADMEVNNVENTPGEQSVPSFPDDKLIDPPPASSASDSHIPTYPQVSASNSQELPPAANLVQSVKKHPTPLSIEDLTSFFRSKNDKITKTEKQMVDSESGKATPYEYLGIISRFLFKISLLIISCTALIFSYTAMVTAKSNSSMKQ